MVHAVDKVPPPKALRRSSREYKVSRLRMSFLTFFFIDISF